MYESIRDGNIESIQKLLAETPAKASEPYGFLGQGPLHFCAKFNRITIAHLLLQTYAANVDAKDKRGSTPFREAITKEHYAMARLLIEYGANVDHLDENGCSALFLVVRNASDEDISLEDRNVYTRMVASLLRLRANCQILDGSRESPLLMALRRKYSEELIEELLDAGAGIGCNFDRLLLFIKDQDKEKLKADFEKMTQHKILLFSKCSQWKVHPIAITSLECLEKAVKEKIDFDFTALINTAKKMLSSNLIPSADVEQFSGFIQKLEEYKIVQDVRKAERVSPLERLSIKAVANHLFHQKISLKNVESLPTQLAEEVVKSYISQLRALKPH